jgi:uncharacterized OB-fold protein
MSTVLLERSDRAYLHKYLTYCADCGRLSYDNEGLCKCGGSETLEHVSHLGEIYSYTTVHQCAEPFVLALVRLSEGPLVTGRIVGIDRELKVGLPVEFMPDAEPLPGSESGGLSFCLLGANAAARR